MEFGMRAGQPASSTPAVVDWYTPANYQTSGTSGAYGGYMGGQGGAGGGTMIYGGTGFEDEPPLLEELGIDVPAILRKTRAILFLRLGSKYLDDLDMGGALMFVFALGGLHLLMGKLHFGIVLGWGVVHSAALWFLVTQLTGQLEGQSEGRDLGLYGCCCLVGYCLVPIVVQAALGLLVPRGPISVALAVLCTAWSAVTAVWVLARRSAALDELRSLVLFPCFLLFSAFSLLTLY